MRLRDHRPVKFVQLDHARLTTHQGWYGQTSLRFIFRLDDCPPSVSEANLKTHTRGAGQGRVRMYIVEAGQWLARQARCVEVIDVVDLHIEYVEEVEHEPRTIRHAVADLAIHERR